MKIVSYNMRNGGHKREDNHWQRLLTEFNPDIVLAQESFNPQDYFPKDLLSDDKSISTAWKDTARSYWGSAIFTRNMRIEEIPAHADFKGWVTGAKISSFPIGSASSDLFAFSVHTPSPGPYEKKVLEILDYLRNFSKENDVLIAGDFNTDTAFRHESEGANLKNTKKELLILERLRREFGLINAWQAIHPNTNLPQTLRWSSNKETPYHCDAIFIPSAWLRHVRSCEVIESGWSDMSDHNPIVLELDS